LDELEQQQHCGHASDHYAAGLTCSSASAYFSSSADVSFVFPTRDAAKQQPAANISAWVKCKHRANKMSDARFYKRKTCHQSEGVPALHSSSMPHSSLPRAI
jgi:hypothetical protein